MPVTTAGPPPAGIYWWAAIYTSFELTVAAQLAMRNIPDAHVDLQVTPKIGMRPPQSFTLLANASLEMQVGTEETAEFALTATPSLRMGHTPSTSFHLQVTVSMSFTATAEAPHGRQTNATISRAATI